MRRVLILGSDADAWAGRIRQHSRVGLEVEAVRRPAAGIRKMESWSPDAVAVAESTPRRRRPLVDAVRSRPLGQLVPVVLLGADGAGPDLEVDGLVGADAHIGRLYELLDAVIEEDGSSGGASTASGMGDGSFAGRPPGREGRDSPPAGDAEQATRGGSRDYVIEPVDPADGPDASSGASGRPSSAAPSRDAPDGAEIERMLNEVRHRDYFAVLDVPRSADDDDVREAYRRLKERFGRSNLPSDVAREYDAAIDEIHDALDDAASVLADRQLREAYLDRTTRK